METMEALSKPAQGYEGRAESGGGWECELLDGAPEVGDVVAGFAERLA